MGFGDDEPAEEESAGLTEKDFYEKIHSSLNASNWSVAISNLQLLESQFPFGKYAEQGQLELIYAHYKSGDYESSIAASDRLFACTPNIPMSITLFTLKVWPRLPRHRASLVAMYPPTKHSVT